MSINTTISQQDVDRAQQRRFELLQRLDREPAFDNARATLDQAERNQARSSSGSINTLPDSIVERTKRAKQRLRKNLDSVQSAASHFYQETLPTAPGEIGVRALLSTDVVSSKNAMGEPKTQVTVNFRPLTKAAFVSRRATFFDDAPASKSKHHKEQEGTKTEKHDHVTSVLRIKIAVHPNASSDDVAKFLGFARSLAEDKGAPFNFSLVADEQNPQQQVLVISVSDDDDDLDALQEIVREVMGVVMGSRYQAKELIEELNDEESEGGGLTEMIRLATVKLELPQHLGEWLQRGADATRGESWMTLLEGLRASAEVVLRDAYTARAVPALAKDLLDDGSGMGIEDVAKLLAAQIVRDQSIHVKMAPAELLYATAVRELGGAWRRKVEEKIKQAKEEEGGEGVDQGMLRAVEELLSTTFPEDRIASRAAMFSLFGVDNHMVRHALATQLLGPLMQEQAQIVQAMILPVKALFGELKSVEALTQSGEVTATFRGIDSKLHDWLPNDAQKAMDEFVKPESLAGVSKEDFEKLVGADKLPRTSTRAHGAMGVWQLEPAFQEGVVEALWTKGAEAAGVEELKLGDDVVTESASASRLTRLVPFVAGFKVQRPHQRTPAVADDNSGATAASASAWDFPQQQPTEQQKIVDASDFLSKFNKAYEEEMEALVGKKKEKAEERNVDQIAECHQQEEEQVNSMASPLGAREEVVQTAGDTMITCKKCGETHSTSVQHNCEQQVASASGEGRPLLRRDEEKSDAVGDTMVTCGKCGQKHSTSVQHNCEQQVAVASGEGRPLLRREDEAPDTVGDTIVTCEKCGEKHSTSVQHICELLQQSTAAAAGQGGRPLIRPSPPRAGAAAGGRSGIGSPRSPASPRSLGRNNRDISAGKPSRHGKLFQRLGNSFEIPTDTASLKEIFESFDVDGNGFISLEELQSELKEFTAVMGVEMTDRDIAAEFRRCDKNGDGKLTFLEFAMVMSRRAAKM